MQKAWFSVALVLTVDSSHVYRKTQALAEASPMARSWTVLLSSAGFYTFIILQSFAQRQP